MLKEIQSPAVYTLISKGDAMKYLLLLAISTAAYAQPQSQTYFPPLDINELHSIQVAQERKGEPPEFAVPREINVKPAHWIHEAGKMVWRHQVEATNAVNLNFGFHHFYLPPSAVLSIYSADHTQFIRPFTYEDNNVYQELWTPVILTDKAIIEVKIDEKEIAELKLSLNYVGQGFRQIGQSTNKAGSCNIDVTCEEGIGWEKEASSVAVLAINGRSFCTGFMVNNAKQDKTPFFMTANHCRVNASTAKSLVVYWNYQKPFCRSGRGRYQDFQTGAIHLASWAKSDFTLVKLLSGPKEEWNISYSGWSNEDLSPASAVGIHHPNTDEKSISFDFDETKVTKYLSEAEGERTHIRIGNWDKGTTEPGSSGSPLYDQNQRVVGQLHGGYASCSSKTADWYGRFHTSWHGGGEGHNSLAPHLDPEQTGIIFIDTL